MPTSMAVDRHGVAWVLYDDGQIFHVSVNDASCTPTKYVADPSFRKFGMGFSTRVAGGDEETLWLNDSAGSGLATLDTTTLALTRAGAFTGALAGHAAELTGTGDGRLFAFAATSPATLAEIDKTTGATPSPRSLDTVSTGTDWAFSFWGGDFYFYTANSGGFPDNTTDVTKLESATGKLQVVLTNIGFRVVGAGVSTCAPTAPPR
jgi:hypothetical protein